MCIVLIMLYTDCIFLRSQFTKYRTACIHDLAWGMTGLEFVNGHVVESELKPICSCFLKRIMNPRFWGRNSFDFVDWRVRVDELRAVEIIEVSTDFTEDISSVSAKIFDWCSELPLAIPHGFSTSTQCPIIPFSFLSVRLPDSQMYAWAEALVRAFGVSGDVYSLSFTMSDRISWIAWKIFFIRSNPW